MKLSKGLRGLVLISAVAAARSLSAGPADEIIFFGVPDRGWGVMPAQVGGPFDDPTEPGRDLDVVILRQRIAAEASGVAEAYFDTWMFEGLGAEGERRRLEAKLKLGIDDVDDICRLNDSQKSKLRLAGEQDLRRFFQSIDALRNRQRIRLPEADLNKLVDGLLAARVCREYELLDEQSFLRKVLPKTLTDEQAERFERIDRERRWQRYEPRLVAVVKELAALLELSDEQRRGVAQMLREETRPPRRFGRFDRDVVLSQMALLKSSSYERLVDADQGEELKGFLSHFVAANRFFDAMGLLSADPADRLPAGIAAAGAATAGDSRDRPAGTASAAPAALVPQDTLEMLAKLINKADEELAERQPAPSRPKRHWGAEQVEGPPDTPHAGDLVTAWASSSPDNQEEWLICHYPERVDVRALVIHENCSPGAVTKVSVFDDTNKEVVAWEGVDPTPTTEKMGISIIPLKAGFKTSKVKIHIDSVAVPGFNEIDAAGLRDSAGEMQWAQRVEASSTFGMGPVQQRAAPPPVDVLRVHRLEAEIVELRKELDRLRKLEEEVEELKRLVKERN